MERLAVTMTVGYYKQVKRLLFFLFLFFKFHTPRCCSNNQKGILPGTDLILRRNEKTFKGQANFIK